VRQKCLQPVPCVRATPHVPTLSIRVYWKCGGNGKIDWHVKSLTSVLCKCRSSVNHPKAGGLSAAERERRAIQLLYFTRISGSTCAFINQFPFPPPPEINNIIKPPSRKLLLKTIIKLITIVVLFIQNVYIIYVCTYTLSRVFVCECNLCLGAASASDR